MDILFVAPYVPSLIRVRPFNLIRFLAEQGHTVTLVALGVDGADEDNAAAEAIAQYCRAIHVVPHSKAQALASCLVRSATPTPLWAAYCFSPAMERTLRQLTDAHSFDVAHIEHLRAAHFARVLRGRLPLVYDAVDCITELQRQLMAARSRGALARAVSWEEHAKLRSYEPKAASWFDQVLITSPQDAECLQTLADGRRMDLPITVLPNGVDLDYFQPDIRLKVRPHNIVFSGKMSYTANRDAALHFICDIFPLVRRDCPSATLTIAGSGPTPDIKALAQQPGSGIVVTGRVDDLRPHIVQAAVTVCPLRIGVGIQNKVLEAMAMGKAVVATPLASRALEAGSGDCLRIAATPEAFAAHVVALLGDPRQSANLGLYARRYVEKHHDWRQAAAQAVAVYRRAARLPQEDTRAVA